MATPVDAKAFAKLKRIAPNLLAAQRAPDDWHARPLPEELCFKLTNRCDLRCAHCYHWGSEGYHRRLPSIELEQDLPLLVIADVLAATRGLCSNVFLWGGEPLLYREWDGLVELLTAEARWTTICSNGTQVERRLASLLRISSRLELSLSIDGFAAEHDALRGAGSFARTLAGVRTLVRCRRDGSYRGELTVNCVISDAMVGKLDDYLRFLAAEGIDTVYLSLPWYISDETASEMQAYLAGHFPELAAQQHPSWRSFGFKLAAGRAAELVQALARVEQTPRGLKLRHNPRVAAGELPEFLSGSSTPMQGKRQCLALRTRLDVFPNADVVACKFFPEFTVGNLRRASLPEIWHGPAFDRLRETLARDGLMPVCAKCNLLYARGR